MQRCECLSNDLCINVRIADETVHAARVLLDSTRDLIKGFLVYASWSTQSNRLWNFSSNVQLWCILNLDVCFGHRYLYRNASWNKLENTARRNSGLNQIRNEQHSGELQWPRSGKRIIFFIKLRNSSVIFYSMVATKWLTPNVNEKGLDNKKIR